METKHADGHSDRTPIMRSHYVQSTH